MQVYSRFQHFTLGWQRETTSGFDQTDNINVVALGRILPFVADKQLKSKLEKLHALFVLDEAPSKF